MTRRIILLLAPAVLLFACSRTPPEKSEKPAPISSTDAVARAVPQIAQATRAGHSVIFVGLDGADWQLLDDYMARGVMPNLARLVRDGASGVVETINPPLSPIVWTTMMTGVSPLEHRVLDFVQFNPQSRAREPITSSARRSPAIWNMATWAGKRVDTFGLWATYPAEPVNGVMVSDRLLGFLFNESAPPPGVVYPPDREGWARDVLQSAQRAIDETALKAYLPWLTHDEYVRRADSSDPYGDPVSALRRILVETRVYDELGRGGFERDHPDLTIIYLQGTDTIGHVFAPYAPPRQVAVPQTDYEKYSQVPEQYFRAIDDRLGEYRRLAEAANAVLMLASDHGFLWKEGRPTALSSNATATAAKWHRREGMYLVWGPGITAVPGHARRGSVQQVCATLLALLGLPSGREIPGPPLPGIDVSSGPPADYQAFYRSAKPSSTTTAIDRDALAKLRSLGYIGGDIKPESVSEGSGRTPASFNNEGLILRDRGKTAEAIKAFEQALALDPALASASWNLSDMLFAKGDVDRSDDLLLSAFAHDLPEGTRYLIVRAIAHQRGGQADRALKLLNAALQARPDNAEVVLFRGRYRVETRDCAGAVEDFQRAERLTPRDPAPYASEGVARMCLGDRAGAGKAFTTSLQLDPAQPNVREFLTTLGRTP